MPDPWSDWLLQKRHGGDEYYRTLLQRERLRIRDKVLDAARLTSGMTLIDIGTGDGLIAFGAFERAGPDLRVILTDTSDLLLEYVEERARELGVADSCTFLKSSAEQLNGIADETADIITMRAVLAYIANKELVASTLYRTLKPGGRVTIGEPIFRENALQCEEITRRLLDRPHDEGYVMAALHQRWRAAQFPSNLEERMSNPLTNFSERDLVTIFQKAQFRDIHLEFHIDLRQSAAMCWDTFLDKVHRPQVPSLREIMDASFSPAERTVFEKNMRPMVESGGVPEFTAIAYLTAIKRG